MSLLEAYCMDKRLGDIIKPTFDPSTDEMDIVIIGCPTDEGVRRNGGRVGARRAPSVFRHFIKRLGTIPNPRYTCDLESVKIADFGDAVGASLEEMHADLARKVEIVVKAGAIPFVVGGGHDIAYPDYLGLSAGLGSTDIGIINIDAHLDVREKKEGKVHSGSPFRMILESEGYSGTIEEFAVQSHQCSVADTQYCIDKGCRIDWLRDLREDSGPYENPISIFRKVLGIADFESTFVSFDVDAISYAFCPGCSCPSPMGLTSEEAIDIMYEAGRNSRCSVADTQYCIDKGCRIDWLRDLREDSGPYENPISIFRKVLGIADFESTFVSFDVDAISYAFCPGCSCPSPMGLTSEEAIDIMYEAGRNSRVRMVDMPEFNPDAEEYLTGKLVATMFYFFVLGYGRRLEIEVEEVERAAADAEVLRIQKNEWESEDKADTSALYSNERVEDAWCTPVKDMK
ncbi:Ureohydrolase like protein [Aduncisulcus paluster]|uniref:Ureohydrolase like protein n=1 Tax=Aduncisulcus paluster TaxID=2918883 RepID=A0ABQ5KTK9_9EUKA|nr:Ureohydrolase like protein [Aduncisulcus paluster]